MFQFKNKFKFRNIHNRETKEKKNEIRIKFYSHDFYYKETLTWNF